MKLLKKILVWVFAIAFTVCSNGAYMYFKFVAGADEKDEVTAKAASSAAPSVTPSPVPEDISRDVFGVLSFEYPKEWTKKESSGRMYYYAADNTFMMIGKNKTQSPLDDSYFSGILDGFKKSQENFLEISRERAQNKNGVKYFSAKYNQTVNKENYLCSLVVLKVNSELYMIGFTQPVTNSENYSGEFSKVIDSIKIVQSK